MFNHIFQNKLLKNEQLSSLNIVKFSEYRFSTSILIFNIKYHHLEFKNDNFFHIFHNQLNYLPTHYFIKFKTIKDKVDKFLYELLMALFTRNYTIKILTNR